MASQSIVLRPPCVLPPAVAPRTLTPRPSAHQPSSHPHRRSLPAAAIADDQASSSGAYPPQGSVQLSAQTAPSTAQTYAPPADPEAQLKLCGQLLTFSTARSFISWRLRLYPDGARVQADDHDMLATLLQFHPGRDEKIGSGIKSFVTQETGMGSRCFWVERTDGSLVDFRCEEAHGSDHALLTPHRQARFTHSQGMPAFTSVKCQLDVSAAQTGALGGSVRQVQLSYARQRSSIGLCFVVCPSHTCAVTLSACKPWTTCTRTTWLTPRVYPSAHQLISDTSKYPCPGCLPTTQKHNSGGGKTAADSHRGRSRRHRCPPQIQAHYHPCIQRTKTIGLRPSHHKQQRQPRTQQLRLRRKRRRRRRCRHSTSRYLSGRSHSRVTFGLGLTGRRGKTGQSRSSSSSHQTWRDRQIGWISQGRILTVGDSISSSHSKGRGRDSSSGQT